MPEFNPELDLQIERKMSAPAEKIWRCWEEPELFKQWFVPPPVEVVDCEHQFYPGGRSYVEMKLPDGSFQKGDGCFLIVERHKRLLWTDALHQGFRPAPEAGFMSCDITLTPVAGGTLYAALVKHSDAAKKKAHEDMGFSDGWGTTFAQLDALASGL